MRGIIADAGSMPTQHRREALHRASPVASAKERQLEAENRQLKAKVGELVMDTDLLYRKIERLEDGIPLHLRKSKR